MNITRRELVDDIMGMVKNLDMQMDPSVLAYRMRVLDEQLLNMSVPALKMLRASMNKAMVIGR